jgi:hypothetical protein
MTSTEWLRTVTNRALVLSAMNVIACEEDECTDIETPYAIELEAGATECREVCLANAESREFRRCTVEQMPMMGFRPAYAEAHCIAVVRSCPEDDTSSSGCGGGSSCPPNQDCWGRGRPPAGYVTAPPQSDAIGDWFAHGAELEAASVHAFRHLVRDLERLGAPAVLVDRARRACRDEVRHARLMGRLARRQGARARTARPSPYDAERAPLAVAVENVVEGCIGETYGAVVASWAARHARPIKLRRDLARLAAEELEHAALSWDIAAWNASGLKDEERETLRRAFSDGLEHLVRRAHDESSMGAVRAGLTPPRATRLVMAREVGCLIRERARALLRGSTAGRLSCNGSIPLA